MSHVAMWGKTCQVTRPAEESVWTAGGAGYAEVLGAGWRGGRPARMRSEGSRGRDSQHLMGCAEVFAISSGMKIHWQF